MKRAIGCAVLLMLTAACGDKGGAAGSSAPAGSAAPKAAKSSAPSGSSSAAATPSGSASAEAAAPAGGGIEVLGGADWKAVFTGSPPIKLEVTYGGGRGDGLSDDFTSHSPDPNRYKTPWKYNAAGDGGINWSPTKKAVLVTNINLKLNATQKTIDLWSKSALIKDLKHTAGPEVLALGPNKAPVSAGAGTCTLKDGEAADVYWYDANSLGDFAHHLHIVIVAKDAPQEEKEVALSILRGFEYTAKAKPTFKL